MPAQKTEGSAICLTAAHHGFPGGATVVDRRKKDVHAPNGGEES